MPTPTLSYNSSEWRRLDRKHEVYMAELDGSSNHTLDLKRLLGAYDNAGFKIPKQGVASQVGRTDCGRNAIDHNKLGMEQDRRGDWPGVHEEAPR